MVVRNRKKNSLGILSLFCKFQNDFFSLFRKTFIVYNYVSMYREIAYLTIVTHCSCLRYIYQKMGKMEKWKNGKMAKMVKKVYNKKILPLK